MNVKKKTRLLSLFLSFVLIISVVSVAVVVNAETEKKIVMVELKSDLETTGVEILETYPRQALVRIDQRQRTSLEDLGISVEELPGRTEMTIKQHQFDINGGYPEFEEELMIDNYEEGVAGLHIVHTLGPVHPEWRSSLESMGVDIINYAPNYAYEVRMTPEVASEVEDMYFVDWVGIYQPGFKLARSLTSGIVSLSLLPGTDMDTVEAIGDIGDILSYSQGPLGGTMHLYVDSMDSLTELAQLNDVYYIDNYVEPQLHDEMASQIIGGGLWKLDDDDDPFTPYRAYGDYGAYVNQKFGLSGEGVVIAVADTGLGNGTVGNTGHEDFTGRVIGGHGWGDDPNYWVDNHGHGTHCAGSAAGDTHGGTEEEMEFAPYYKGQGLAYGSELYSAKIFGEDAEWIGGSDYYKIVRIPKQLADAYVHTNSWGGAVEGTYPSSSSEFDMAVRDADNDTAGNQPMVITTSAGNDGPAEITIGAPATAKNVITVGATHNFNLDAGVSNPDMMVGFSSRGWTVDNRVKPDIVAPGHGISSTMPTGGYATMSGTSMSNPAVAGATAVVVGWYENLYGIKPSPAMVKAMLINTAYDMDDENGNTGPIPNRDEGWGMVNLPALVDAPVEYMFEDQTELITTGDEHEYTITWEDDLVPLKASLVWSDKYALSGDNLTLKNNLDLEVIAPDGTTYYRGNAFPVDENNISTRSFTSADTDAMPEFDQNDDGWDDVNNVLNVYIDPDELVPGEYTVRVIGTNVPEDANNDGEANQDYALFMSNAIEPTELSITLTSPEGGETWKYGDVENITWEASSGSVPIPGDGVDLFYTLDEGDTWDVIATGLPAVGTYSWAIPDRPTTTARVRAIVRDTAANSRPHTSRQIDIIGTPPASPTDLGVTNYLGQAAHVVDDFQDGDYTTNPEWTVFDGGWSIEQKDGVRWLEGIGSISTPSTQAYGRWEWDFQFVRTDMVGSDIQAMRFYLIQDTPDPGSSQFSGYYVIVTGDVGGGEGAMNLWRFDNGTNPASPLISVTWDMNTDWNTLAVERDEHGVFTIYHNDKWMASSLPDNTYITSQYIGFRHTTPEPTDRHRVSEIRSVEQVEGDTHNLVKWDRSPDDGVGRNSVSYYEVERAVSDTGPWHIIDTVNADGSEAYSVMDLYAGSHDNIFWWYRVRAIDIHDLYDEVAVLPRQEPIPANLTVEITSPEDGHRFNTDSVTVQWQSSGEVEYYNLYLDNGDSIFKLERSHNFIDLPYGAYEVTVEAVGPNATASDTVSFIVDTSVTPVEITSDSGGITFEESFVIQGVTEPSATVEINGIAVDVNATTGEFEYDVNLVNGFNAFHVTAIGETGIPGYVSVYALYMPDIPDIYDNIDDLQTQIDDVRSDIDAIENLISDSIDDLEGQIAELNASLQEQMGDIVDLENQINALHNDMNAAISNLQSQINGLNTQLESLRADLQAAQDEMDQQQEQLDDQDNNISHLQDEITALETVINNLTGDLESLEIDLESEITAVSSQLQTHREMQEELDADQDAEISSAASMAMIALVVGILGLLLGIVAMTTKGKKSGAVSEAEPFEQDLEDEPLYKEDDEEIDDDDIF
ncbi:MAG: S8 family serine peptidase [Thermoplasmata archaeon]